jgi:RNA polymerase sigma factor (TIGR02999 family)
LIPLVENAAHDITRLLADWSDGDEQALAALMPVVYDELRELAGRYLRRERPGHTLQTTAVVHEAYLRLADQRRTRWRNRAHFYGIAAQMMRRILIDHARAQRYAKRGGQRRRVSLDGVAELAAERLPELEALDEALSELAALDERRARIVELRYFGGLSNEEISEVLGISANTILRQWRLARAWLYRYLQAGG